MKAALLAVSATAAASLGPHAFAQSWTPTGAPTAPAGWNYTFDDEFSGSALNQDTYINGSNTPSDTWTSLPRWGDANINSEAEVYQKANVQVSGGYLHLVAQKSGNNITSGEIQTQGTDNGVDNIDGKGGSATAPFSQAYGMWEISCKAPQGQGFWPAFWFLPEDLSVGWPPEIDAFELPQCGPGYDPSGTPLNAHVGDIMPPLVSGGANIGDGGWVTPPNNYNISNFNTYAIEWDPNMIKWLINGNVVFTTNGTVPQIPFYQIINLAVGGQWTGPVSSSTPFPSELTVDYDRVFSAAPASTFNWNSSTGGAWTNITPTGWNNTTYPQAPVDTANFNQSLSATQTVTLSNSLTLVGLNLTDTSGAHGWNISGGGYTLTMDSDNSTLPTITAGVGSHIVNAPIALPWLLNVAVNGTQLSLSGPISGVGSVNKSGPGILVLGGSGTASTYTGGTLLTAGTIKAGSSTALGPITNPLTLSAGTTFDLNGYSVGIGDLNGTGTIDNTSGSGNGTITLGNGDSSGSSSTFSGTIQNTVGTLSLVKTGAGSLTLSGTSTYTGTTTVVNGTLLATTNSAFGAASSLLLGDVSGSNSAAIGGGGSSSVTLSRNIVVQAGNTGTASLGSAFSNNDFETTTFSGTITLGSNVGSVPTAHGLTIAAQQWTYTSFSGLIQDPAGLVGIGAPVTITGGYGNYFSHANTFTGGVILEGGCLYINNTAALGTGTFNINGGALAGTISTNAMIWNGNFSNVGGQNVNLGTGAALLTAASTVSVSNGNLTVGGVIGDNGKGYGITFAGGQYGGSLNLNGANTFGGGVSIAPNGGSVTLNIGNLGTTSTASAIGTGTFSINPVPGDTAQFDNSSGAAGTLSTNNSQAWNADFTFLGSHSLNMGTGTVSLGNANQSTRTITVNNNTLTIGGPICNGTNATTPTVNLAKAGGGILTLSAANLYTGSTNVSAGTLDLANALALQNSTLNSGGITFDSSVASHAFTLGAVSGSGNVALSDTASHPVALSVGNNGASTTYSGVLSGAGSVTKLGSGTLTLTGTDTYSGATNVSAGALQLNGVLDSETGVVTVAGGATLAGTGTINRPVTLSNGAVIGGDASTLTVNNKVLTLGTSATFQWDYNGTSSDELAVTGTGSISTPAPANVTLNLIPSANNPSGSYTIMTWASGSTPNINWTVNNSAVSNPSAINWTSGGDGSTWNSGSNWDLTNYSGGTVIQSGNSYVLSNLSTGHPGVQPNDNVTIAAGSSATTITGPTASVTVASLSLGAATGSANQLNLAVGKVSVTGVTTVNTTAVLNTAANSFSTASLLLSGGSVILGNGTAITGTLTATAGILQVASGATAGVGTLDLTTGTATTVNTQGGSLAITNQLKLPNNITATLTGGGSFQASGSSLSDNTAPRTLTLSGGTLILAAPAAGGSIGIQFQGGGAAVGNASNGVVSMTNWNSFTGNTLSTATSLKDATGKTGVATLSSYTAPGTYTTGSAIPLLNGYLDDYSSPGSESVNITNIPYGSYNVYAYFGSDGGGRQGSVKIGSTTYYYSTEGTGGETGYTQTTSTSSSSHPTANYSLFTGLSGSSVTVNQYWGNNNGGLHGIEIVNTALGAALPNTNFAATSTSTLDMSSATGTDGFGGLDLTAGAATTALTLQNALTVTLNADTNGNAISAVGSAAQSASIIPGVNAPVLTIASGENISVAAGVTLTVQSVIGSTSTVNKVGAGTLSLTGSNSYSGNTTVNAGTLQLASTGALPASSILNISSGASVVVNRNGGSCITLNLATLSNSGSVDLQNNQMLLLNVSSGTVSQIFNELNSGYNGGSWSGATGIVSSTAATAASHLYAVGEAPSGANLLVGYTYYGDTNLDGKVDGSDYSRLDSAYLADQTSPGSVTGWYNGDFNYDGVVNGSDYTLIDNAFNTQGAVISSQIANPTAIPTDQISGATSAVPEPGSLTLLGVSAIGLLGRRRSCRQQA